MHSAVQTADVTIISYKPLSGLNFARCTGYYCRYVSPSWGWSISPVMYHVLYCSVTPPRLWLYTDTSILTAKFVENKLAGRCK